MHFFRSLIGLVWKRVSDGVVSHDPARIQGLSDMRRPQTASDLMQFLQAANWLRTSLPRMADVVEPLRVFLEQLMACLLYTSPSPRD